MTTANPSNNSLLYRLFKAVKTPVGTLLLALATAVPALAAELSAQIAKVRPGIVAVGVYEPTRNPSFNFRGTGFVVGDGRHIVTNAHVTPPFLDPQKKQLLIVMVGRGADAKPREVEKVSQDQEHDLAVLRLKGGDPLPSLKLADSAATEGQEIALTGFPLGTVLGLFPVTHRGIVSVVTPIIIPGANTNELDAKAIKNLRKPFEVYQLDAIAYPGNSGSPVYDVGTGDVIGIVNMVFIKGSKEKAITDPSGISYAIPAEHIKRLLERGGSK
jgi:serine protease Do